LIIGRVELLTVRRIAGRVFDDLDPEAPVLIRVRGRGTVLAESQTDPVGMSGIAGANPPNDGRPFLFEFPERLDAAEIEHLVIEASRPADANWTTLSKPPMLKTYPNAQVSMISALERVTRLSSEATPFLPWMEDFWTDDPDAVGIPPAESRPLFVLGAARSGTSAVAVSLRHSTRYRGFKEGHLLEVAIHLADALQGHLAHKDIGIRAKVQGGYHVGRLPHSRIMGEMMAFLRSLTTGFTTPFWLDKTPGHRMVASAPLLAQAWPEARFIFMKRRGLENLKSRRHRFRNAFATDCSAWANVMSTWRMIRAGFGDKAIEIDQRTLLEQPEASAAIIGKLLDLPVEEIEALGAALRHERPQVTDPTHSIVGDISELGWSAEEIAVFRTICGPEMDAYGYTYDSRYRL
jgi:hypothetical protein